MSPHRKALAKAVTWRIVGTADTVFWSYLITGSLKWAGSIGFCELITKSLYYYLHERIWNFERKRSKSVPSEPRYALADRESEDAA
jgi:uncharacterized membrane protein